MNVIKERVVKNNKQIHTSENVPVNLFSNVDFPTEGKPTKPTLASPLLVTSKP